MPGRITTDAASVGMIVLANAFALLVARWQHWALFDLLIPYWIQSVVIGWYSARRMLLVPRFTANGVRYDEEASLDEPTRKLVAAGLSTPERFAKRSRVKFFAMHYGLFHFGYLFFMVLMFLGDKPAGTIAVRPMTASDAAGLALASLAFLLTHRASFKRNLKHDRQGCPNMDMLMFLPYARVVPMHATFVFGFTVGEARAVLLFGSLKALADVLMHWVEHRVLAGSADSRDKG